MRQVPIIRENITAPAVREAVRVFLLLEQGIGRFELQRRREMFAMCAW